MSFFYSPNPFFPTKTNHLYPQNYKRIEFTSSNKANYPTKKRDKENILPNTITNYKEDNATSKNDFSILKQIPRKRVHYTSKKKQIHTKIIFEEEQTTQKPFSVKSFPLYRDKEIYSQNPFDEKIITMKTDEDVTSDNELIEKASNFLCNEINYAIVTIQQHQRYSNNRLN